MLPNMFTCEASTAAAMEFGMEKTFVSAKTPLCVFEL
jgi:hypothetical protein